MRITAITAADVARACGPPDIEQPQGVPQDPIAALLKGRDHYKWALAEPVTLPPTLKETLAHLAALCMSPMVPIEGQEGQAIGYRCPSCGTTASATGRTEHGPRLITTSGPEGWTCLQEPAK